MADTDIKTEDRTAKLQVAAARQEESGQGIARLSRAALSEIGALEGDVLEITGKAVTVARAVLAYEEDEGLSVIRLDGLQRGNAEVGSGDHVVVRKAESRPAQRVVFAPAQKDMRLQGPSVALKRNFFQRPMVQGDLVATTGQQQVADIPPQLRRMFNAPAYALTQIRLNVVSTTPRGIVHIDENTEVELRETFEEAHDARGDVNYDDVGGMGDTIRQLRRMFNAPAYALTQIRLNVVSTTPRGIVHIDENTEVELRETFEEAHDARGDVNYDDVGGMGDTIRQLREMVELPLRYPELFTRLGVAPPKGVLLHGPPGTGKTRLAQAVANESEASFFSINGPEIMGSGYGESEKHLREIFEEATKASPAIIFIDEIDSIAPKRDQVHGEAEKRLVAQLLTLMDGLNSRAHVVVIAATNRPDAIDEALRRPGRFDREIVIGVPDEKGRREILGIHTRGMPLGDRVDLSELARTTHGFVGADLAALAREAAIEAVRRIMPRLDLEARTIPADVLDDLQVLREDFLAALKRVQPSAMREVMVQVPNIGWDDIGGLGEAQLKLKEGIELPLKNPEAFHKLGIRPAKGFLLYGPPGTGKTLLAKAVAKEAEANFISIKSSDLLSKWYGESEQQIAKLFARARQVAPCVIFIDEIDSLVPARGMGGAGGEPQVTARVVNTILAEMDGMEELQSVVLVGATNRPALVDPALLRPGRFDELVYVGTPDAAGREHILGIHTARMPLAPDVSLSSIAERTERFTGADLEDVVRRAGLVAIRKRGASVEAVTREDFEDALEDSRATVTEDMEDEYQRMKGELKKRAMAVTPIGFLAPGMVESTRERKH